MYQWPEDTSRASKIFFDSLGFFYFLFLRFLTPKFDVGVLRFCSGLPEKLLLNTIRGAQFWIFRFTQEKCLWSAKSVAPYELKTKGQYSLALSYKMTDGRVAGHASSGGFLENEEFKTI